MNVFKFVAEYVIGAAYEDIADEDGDGEEGIDVIGGEGSSEIIESRQNCVPT